MAGFIKKQGQTHASTRNRDSYSFGRLRGKKKKTDKKPLHLGNWKAMSDTALTVDNGHSVHRHFIPLRRIVDIDFGKSLHCLLHMIPSSCYSSDILLLDVHLGHIPVQRGRYWHHGHPWWNSQAQGGERSRRRHSYKNKYTHKLREHCKNSKSLSLSLSQHCKTLNSLFCLWALQNPKIPVSSLLYLVIWVTLAFEGWVHALEIYNPKLYRSLLGTYRGPSTWRIKINEPIRLKINYLALYLDQA